MISIRLEQPGDIAAVRAVNEAAFGQPTEAIIVDVLRNACPEAISIVAVEDDQVLGHIFFSAVSVSGGHAVAGGMGLAPMAVLPNRQREGIGTRLVHAGIDAVRERNCPFIVVLGHPKYYPRFGFMPASRHGLSCQWAGVPDDAFMVLVLDTPAMSGVSGTARYRDEFDQAV
ncbi:MAG TPA: N-acetyltransferase [Vicinamibacterales bacterium]|jgi:putative acetyltransferase